MERYDPDINKMLIGGVGVVPKDLGIEMSKKMFAPRAGLAYRLTDTFVLRAGYGITNDPYPLSRPLLHNHPNIVELALFGSNAWTPAGRLANGIPPVPVPSLGNGIIDIEPDVGAVTILPDFRRGYIQSWNLTLQKELKWNFVGEVGYVATRQIRQLGLGELNWAPVGTGRSGQQLFQKFGRTARARVITPIGGTHYDSLQARLERRFAAGFSLDTAYTWGRSITTSGQDNSDGTLRINIPEYYDLNRCLSGFDRTHNLQITHIVELPFGRGKRWLGSGGVLAAIAGGWQINGILSFHSGTPFSIERVGRGVERSGRALRGPIRSSPRSRSWVEWDPASRISTRWPSRRSTSRALATPHSTACAAPASSTGTSVFSATSRSMKGSTSSSEWRRSTSPTRPISGILARTSAA